MEKIEVLNGGYVRLVHAFGSDIDVANAARASYAKESLEFNDKDEKLIRFLAKHGHSSPFRHVFVALEIKAPLMVARQWWKYVTGSDHTMDSWNEASRRYITMEPEFYVPQDDAWRTAPENSKQGSSDPIDPLTGKTLNSLLSDTIDTGMKRYDYALKEGIAAEQARGFLPAYFMYTIWRWSASLQSIGFFLSQRLEEDAQKEIQEYAKAVYELTVPHFPVSIPALLGR